MFRQIEREIDMILKYRNRNERHMPSNTSWHMIDNIASINYTLRKKSELEDEFKKLTDKEVDSCYLPKWFNYHKELNSMWEIYITTRDDSCIHINIDDDLFILSDIGKTIEVAYCVSL